MNGETLIHFFYFFYIFLFLFYFCLLFFYASVAGMVDEMHLNKRAMVLEWGNKLNEGYA